MKKHTKESILEIFMAYVKKHKRTPTRKEMKESGVSRDKIRHHFVSLTGLKDSARVAHPKVFKEIVDETLFEPKKFKKVSDLVAKKKRFVVTTAIAGCQVHKPFYNTIKSYCAKNNATLLILPCADPASNKNWNFDPILAGENFVSSDLSLNSNVHIRMIQLSAKQIDPVTGLQRLSQKDGGFIYASPKQRLQYVPIDAHKLPHPVRSTGAITIPDYDTDKYMSKRTAYVAEFDHVMGALIVELDKDEKYYIREIQAEPKTGRFIDLCKYYFPNGAVKDVSADLVMGDWHSGETEPVVKEATKKLCKSLDIRYLFGHDLCNGKFNNHHDKTKQITRARLAQQNKITLVDELITVIEDINDILTWPIKKVIWVKSNHDEVLHGYLQEGRQNLDPLNYRLASQLVKPFIDGVDPLHYALKNLDKLEKSMVTGKTDKKIPVIKDLNRVQFLQRDESFRVAGIELGAHGDVGPNGSRGSMAGFEKSYGACVVGHSHTPEILRNVWRVGTKSIRRPSYTSGASSWMWTDCLVYSNGARQFINYIDGKWRLK